VDSEGRAADEAVLKESTGKIQKIQREFSMSEIFAYDQLQQCILDFPCKVRNKTIRQLIASFL
jgi:hypothetical protein